MVQEDRVLRYVESGDDVLLYEPSAASRGRAIEAIVEQGVTWGQLRALERDVPEIAGTLKDRLWEQWDNGEHEVFGVTDDQYEDEDEEWDLVADIDELMVRFPEDAWCPLDLMTLDGEPALDLVDPMNPYDMKVPVIVVERHYREESNMTSSWSACAFSELSGVRATLEELGWRLEPGNTDELPLM